MLSLPAEESSAEPVFLTNDTQKREELVLPTTGTLAYSMLKTGDYSGEFRQIFVMNLNWETLKTNIK